MTLKSRPPVKGFPRFDHHPIKSKVDLAHEGADAQHHGVGDVEHHVRVALHDLVEAGAIQARDHRVVLGGDTEEGRLTGQHGQLTGDHARLGREKQDLSIQRPVFSCARLKQLNSYDAKTTIPAKKTSYKKSTLLFHLEYYQKRYVNNTLTLTS